MVSHPIFDVTVAMLIFANAVVLALETQTEAIWIAKYATHPGAGHFDCQSQLLCFLFPCNRVWNRTAIVGVTL